MSVEIYAGVDLGGTNVACIFTKADGSIVCKETIPTQSNKGPQAILQRISDMVCNLSKQSGFRPHALGMGVPGLVDLKNGIARFLPNLPTQWRNVPVRDILSPKIGCPVYLLNDARIATLGELTFGHGLTVQTMVFFALGTGIGGGVVVDGKLRLGPLGAAGELGHQTILPEGPLCGCGNRGCLEALASGPAIISEGIRLMLSGQAPKLYEIVGGNLSAVTPKEMVAAAEAGDESVKEAIVRAVEFLGIGVANVFTALHPDMVVLGGGVAEIGSLLIDTVRNVVFNRVKMFPIKDIRIEQSLLGNMAGALGGIALAMKGGLICE